MTVSQKKVEDVYISIYFRYVKIIISIICMICAYGHNNCISKNTIVIKSKLEKCGKT